MAQGEIRKEDISGIRLEVVEVSSKPFMRFDIFIQVDGKDLYLLDSSPTVGATGDSILVRFPEDPVLKIT